MALLNMYFSLILGAASSNHKVLWVLTNCVFELLIECEFIHISGDTKQSDTQWFDCNYPEIFQNLFGNSCLWSQRQYE